MPFGAFTFVTFAFSSKAIDTVHFQGSIPLESFELINTRGRHVAEAKFLELNLLDFHRHMFSQLSGHAKW